MSFLKYFSDKEVESIHQTTLRILSEIGIVMTQKEGVEILSGAGATVKNDRVYLPPDLVEQEVRKCPNQVYIEGRNKKPIVLGDGSLHFHNAGGARDVYDPAENIHRPATLQDVRDSTRLLDALENCNSITTFFTPQDVPGPLMSLAMYRHALPHTTKPLQGPAVLTVEEVRFAIRMANVIGDPVKTLSLSLSPISPLIFSDDVTASMIETSRQGITMAPLPCPNAGATAPMSIAGGLAQQNAEVLASIVLCQLVNPGLPMVYCGRLCMMNPATAIVGSGIEMALIGAGTVQIGHRYGLPVNVYGLSSASHTADIQNGFERSVNATIPALAGADELSGIGEMEASVMGSYTQMVSDNEIATGIQHLRKGITVDEDSLAFDVIAEAMEGNRNFLDKMHTVNYLRSGELATMKLSETRTLDTWEKQGRKGMNERAAAEAKRILAEHQVPCLSEDQEKELDEIMMEAQQELVES